jgi:uncharacterized LabA/DUF88 family protein
MGESPMSNDRSSSKVGVYVDVENIRLNGGRYMRYNVLREFACRGGGEAVRLNAYAAYSRKEEERTAGFFSQLRDFGYKVITKEIKYYKDEETGKTVSKANADLDLAVDAILQSESLDRVLIATGDGDFVQVVRALQNKGCRVEVVAFENVSVDLRREADMFLCGYLVPGLLPTSTTRIDWGDPKSKVRGTCFSYQQDRRRGLMRFLNRTDSGLWITDTRDPHSPYAIAGFEEDSLPNGIAPGKLPTRNIIFEFVLEEQTDKSNMRFLAKDITVKYEFPFID